MSLSKKVGSSIDEAISFLKRGELIAYPTETFYGIGADPYNDKSIKKLYSTKKRKSDKPIPLIIAHRRMLYEIVEDIPKSYVTLMDLFWPGPLTLIFEAKKKDCLAVSKINHTVAVRISSHPIAQKICDAWGKPLTSTSANISGQSPVKRVADLSSSIINSLEYIVDGGCTPAGSSSTIVTMIDKQLHLVREGKISWDAIQSALRL